MSIKATAKERGDILTDQISMVRVWVYPMLAFIVAFLPTLMVEIGSSTIFQPEHQRPAHRLGFFGRRLHALYIRAGRQKILRAERLANEAAAEIAAREQALAAANAAAAEQEERLRKMAEEHAEQAKNTETQWVTKVSTMADTLNRAVVEKDALRDLQKSEIERQIQMRQNAWTERLTQARQELDDQRAAHEAERAALIQEHHQKLAEVTEDCANQVTQARRQLAAAELAAVEKSGKLANELKQALQDRDEAESQLKHQVDSLTVKLSQTEEDAARQLEKAAREEKHQLERQQLEFEKTLRQREEDFEHRAKQREQELAFAFDARLAEEKSKIDQNARFRQADLERQIEDRAREIDGRWKQEAQRREEAAQIKLKQREQQLQAQTESRLSELQTQANQALNRREAELKHQLEAQAHESAARLDQQLQQQELTFQAKLKQREQDLAAKADTREAEVQKQWTARLRVREEEWERQAEVAVRAAEARFNQELQQKEDLFLSKSRQREEQWQTKLDAAVAELQAKVASIEPYKELVARAEAERDEAKQSAEDAARQVQGLEKKLTEASSFLSGWKKKLADAA